MGAHAGWSACAMVRVSGFAQYFIEFGKTGTAGFSLKVSQHAPHDQMAETSWNRHSKWIGGCNLKHAGQKTARRDRKGTI
jgi:hypothetical protein